MLDGIPLGRAGGIVSDSHGEAEGIDQLRLQFRFPGVSTITIAAAGVGEYQYFIGAGIA